MNHIVGLSGGKDSTAMALRLAEVEPRDYTYICTPTAHELPEMEQHWQKLEGLLGKPIVRVTNHDLDFWIHEFNALPNWRQRWCTRLLKIEPTIAYVQAHQPATNYVGLRADEDTREGIYGDDIVSDFPMRRWGWGIDDVLGYLRERGVSIPWRTDCFDCFFQRLADWKRLLRTHPDLYAIAEAYEAQTGFTYRSPGRDTWPASLAELRQAFAAGRYVRGENLQGDLFESEPSCRACSL